MQALGQGGGLGQQLRQGPKACLGVSGIEHRGDDSAGPGILKREEVEQWPGAQQDAAAADGTALGLQHDLGPAQREDPGQRPAGNWNDPIHGACRQDQPVIGQRLAAARAGDVHAPPAMSQARVSGR